MGALAVGGVPEEEEEVKEVRVDLLMGKDSYVYTFGAQVVETRFSLGAWVLLPRVPAGAVLTSWSRDHLVWDSSFTGY